MGKADTELKLFDFPVKVPKGFIYCRNFISEAKEQELIREIRSLELTPFKYYQFTGKRRTASFGWQYEFGQNEIKAAPPIPLFLLPLRTAAEKLFHLDSGSLTQASIIEYPIGAPIGWHRDIPHFGLVIGISLGSPCRMRLRSYRHARFKIALRDETVSLELQPRSIYLMSGASRELWQHSISPVKEPRYSITMRTVRAITNAISG